MRKIRINPVAKKDLLEIKEYVEVELGNPDAAIGVLTEIIICYEKLKDFPKAGMELKEKVELPTDYRYLICGNYLVFYKLDDEYISIYRILYSRRDYIKILLDDKNE
ncbi:type II toxin-antitoxin system RelE/ParE family toxin [Halobacillus sp. MO56]